MQRLFNAINNVKNNFLFYYLYDYRTCRITIGSSPMMYSALLPENTKLLQFGRVVDPLGQRIASRSVPYF